MEVPMRARYRHSHWVGAERIGKNETEFFDVNCAVIGGWVTLIEWERDEMKLEHGDSILNDSITNHPDVAAAFELLKPLLGDRGRSGTIYFESTCWRCDGYPFG
jgi:hypothetical protein